MSCRFKLSAGGQVGISIAGPNPVVERDFNVAGVPIRADAVTAWDNDVLHPKGSPQAAELKAKGDEECEPVEVVHAISLLGA